MKPTPLEKKEYAGSPSTLCTGCGHDSITNHIISAFHQLAIHPHDVVKTSGIGCSSKTPAYFMSKSFGINTLHGRMASVSTGAKVVSPHLHYIGISGDGDTASIGLSGFIHMIRRNLPICYIIANNGVYGLTKGQFSATSEKGSPLKTGEINPFEMIDVCSLALEVGCGFVARSFSGDMKQLVPLIKAGLEHRGTAIIDVISPCITFNNHDGSTKSYNYVKEHDISLQELDFIAPFEDKAIDYAEGTVEVVEMPNGSKLTLRKIHSAEHNVHDRLGSMKMLHESSKKGEVLTGLFYIDEEQSNLIETLQLTEKPLPQLNEQELRPTPEQLQKIMGSFK